MSNKFIDTEADWFYYLDDSTTRTDDIRQRIENIIVKTKKACKITDQFLAVQLIGRKLPETMDELHDVIKSISDFAIDKAEVKK